jgi:competence protein ComEA
VQSAGGLTAAAAPTALNLAAKVKDGEKVIVPAFGDTRPAPIPAVSGALEAEPNGADPNGKVNLNTAGETALCDLPGIGPTRARAIIAYREEHGDFQVIDELLEVNGIGPATFEQLKDRVTLE